MKNIRYFILLSLLICLCGCKVSYNDGIIGDDTYGNAVRIDPGFTTGGMIDVYMVNIYKEYVQELTIQRRYGLSKELSVTLEVDPAILSDYNEQYSTQYELLPSEYYQLPQPFTWPAETQDVGTSVKLLPEKLAADKGVENARNYVLPVRATYAGAEVNALPAFNEILLKMDMDQARLTVDVPQKEHKLSFAAGSSSALKDYVEIEIDYNFEGFDGNNVSFKKFTQPDVDGYNNANGTDYVLLPEEYYSFSFKADTETPGKATLRGAFNIDDNLVIGTSYMLPVMLQSGLYSVVQPKPVYIVVDITGTFVSIKDAGTVRKLKGRSKSSITGRIQVDANVPVIQNTRIKLDYDNSKIAEYNAANGTGFGELPGGTFSVSEATMTAGTKTVNVTFSVNATDLPYDTHYLIPLVIDQSVFDGGTFLDGQDVVYVDFYTSILGTVTPALDPSSNTRNDYFVTNIKEVKLLADGPRGTGLVSDEAPPVAPWYMTTFDGDWYALAFSITNEQAGTNAKHKKVVIGGCLEPAATNPITNNNSYYDVSTGVFHMHFSVTENWLGQTFTYKFTLTPSE